MADGQGWHAAGTCVAGQPLREPRKARANTGEAPGPCAGCGRGPLHGALNACKCSAIRQGHRVCRDCAIAYDLCVVGRTTFQDPPFTPEDIAAVLVLIRDARRVAELKPRR